MIIDTQIVVKFLVCLSRYCYVYNKMLTTFTFDVSWILSKEPQ